MGPTDASLKVLQYTTLDTPPISLSDDFRKCYFPKTVKSGVGKSGCSGGGMAVVVVNHSLVSRSRHGGELSAIMTPRRATISHFSV